MRKWSTAVPIEDREPKTYAFEGNVSFSTSEALGSAYGGALPSGYSRAVIESPLFDCKPWLKTESTGGANIAVTAVDTSSACDSYDPHLDFVLRSSTAGQALIAVENIGAIRIWWFDKGHPKIAAKAAPMRAREELTLRFIDEVSDSWRYTIAPTGLRFWGAGLILEAPTATLPRLTAALSMH